MAVYRFSATIIGRAAGRSAVAAIAYRAAERIVDARTGLEHDFTRRRGVLHSEILTPENTPEWMRDRAALWNAVEAAERRRDAQLAREIQLSLPHELDERQRIRLVRDFVRQEFVSRGMVADIAVHAPDRHGDNRNHHAHVLLTMREVTAGGFGKKARDWNTNERLEQWRERWADVQNRALKEIGSRERVDHRSYEARGIDREPQPKLGPTASEMERKGKASDKGDERRAVWQRNGLREALRKEAEVVDLALERDKRERAAAASRQAQAQYRQAAGQREAAGDPRAASQARDKAAAEQQAQQSRQAEGRRERPAGLSPEDARQKAAAERQAIKDRVEKARQQAAAERQEFKDREAEAERAAAGGPSPARDQTARPSGQDHEPAQQQQPPPRERPDPAERARERFAQWAGTHRANLQGRQADERGEQGNRQERERLVLDHELAETYGPGRIEAEAQRDQARARLKRGGFFYRFFGGSDRDRKAARAARRALENIDRREAEKRGGLEARHTEERRQMAEHHTAQDRRLEDHIARTYEDREAAGWREAPDRDLHSAWDRANDNQPGGGPTPGRERTRAPEP